jgi:hypothetical protein
MERLKNAEPDCYNITVGNRRRDYSPDGNGVEKLGTLLDEINNVST